MSDFACFTELVISSFTMRLSGRASVVEIPQFGLWTAMVLLN